MTTTNEAEPAPEATAEFIRTLSMATLAVIAVVATLFLARAFCVPIALALFFNTLFRPVVRRLEELRVPTPAGAALVVMGFLGVLAICIAILWSPGQKWIEQAPERVAAIQTRIHAITRPLERVSAAADKLQSSSEPPAGESTVTITPVRPRALAQVFGTTATASALVTEVVLLFYLLLASGGMFLERLISVIPGRTDKRTAVRIANEVEAAVSRYLGATTLINIGQGAVVGLTLWAIGMPDPLLWAALTFVLEYIPFLGGLAMVVLLLLSALTTFESLGHALIAPLAYLVISALQNYVASPLLYGRRLRLNPVALLVAVVFWAYLWGVVGAFLAVPILAAVKIMCDHLDPMESLGKFLEA